jgi:dTMP kinase
MERLATARTPDKFEREDKTFFEKLRQVYLQRAKNDPNRFRVINADKSLDEVRKEVKVIVEKFILTN